MLELYVSSIHYIVLSFQAGGLFIISSKKKFLPRACTHRDIRELLLLLHDGIQLLFKGVLSCSGSEQSMSEFNELELFFGAKIKQPTGFSLL